MALEPKLLICEPYTGAPGDDFHGYVVVSIDVRSGRRDPVRKKIMTHASAQALLATLQESKGLGNTRYVIAELRE
jgi:hypothetical protein